MIRNWMKTQSWVKSKLIFPRSSTDQPMSFDITLTVRSYLRKTDLEDMHLEAFKHSMESRTTTIMATSLNYVHESNGRWLVITNVHFTSRSHVAYTRIETHIESRPHRRQQAVRKRSASHYNMWHRGTVCLPAVPCGLTCVTNLTTSASAYSSLCGTITRTSFIYLDSYNHMRNYNSKHLSICQFLYLFRGPST